VIRNAGKMSDTETASWAWVLMPNMPIFCFEPNLPSCHGDGEPPHHSRYSDFSCSQKKLA
jgi:hypothetical protein